MASSAAFAANLESVRGISLEEHWPPLVRALTEPARYPHPVDEVTGVETHISYVLLTGDFAYKLKKPLDLGFLDFSTLAQRRQACEEEVRINRRTAPELYLGVWPVTGSPEDPVLNGEGEPFDYLVRMVQFDPDRAGDRCLERGELGPEHLETLGDRVAALHQEAETPPEETDYGTLGAIRQEQEANLDQLLELIEVLGIEEGRVQALADWIRASLADLGSIIEGRRAQGLVREGHGDLHLGNLVLRDGALVPFDAIEFDPALRFSDVMADVAFAWMDLKARGRRDLGVAFLNRYLERTGDYPGLPLLPLYTVYRALVRAKVSALQVEEETSAGGEARDLAGRAAAYFELAEATASGRSALLIIARGVTGVGKSTVSRPVLAEVGGVRIRSDVERKRLAGLEPEESGRAEVGAGIYEEDLSERTYRRLLELARPALRAGYPVLLDATFLEADRRQSARDLAAELGVPFAILALEAPEATIRQWIRKRAKGGTDASDADESVLDDQLATEEPLTEGEEACAVRIDTSRAPGPSDLARELVDQARIPDRSST